MLLVNLFGGPGCGKSTTAALVFGALKSAGMCAELVLEFAKDLCWEGRQSAMRCQPYLFGEQLWRTQRLADAGVEVAVTDSPLLLSVVYGSAMPQSFRAMARDIAQSFDRVNFMLERVKPYDGRGRLQDESGARDLDAAILATLSDCGEQFSIAPGTPDGADLITARVLSRMYFSER